MQSNRWEDVVMNLWAMQKMAQQRSAEAHHQAEGRRQVRALRGGPGVRIRRRDRLAVWIGYRIIGVGCRLVRPALVAFPSGT
jgi:hypothetical protein